MVLSAHAAHTTQATTITVRPLPAVAVERTARSAKVVTTRPTTTTEIGSSITAQGNSPWETSSSPGSRYFLIAPGASVAGVREKSVVDIEPQAFEWNENTENSVWIVFEMNLNASPTMFVDEMGSW